VGFSSIKVTKRKVNRLLKLLHRNERGFTFIEVIVVVAILGILAAVIVPNILSLMNKGREEAKLTEYHNIQIAVHAMMFDASAIKLDNSSGYEAIDELTEVHGVTATDTGTSTTYYLDDYLTSGKYPLQQAYDITQDGDVTIHSE
jgi:prepilin-type N-terminal cleavage/methylation domain-containing protein